MDTNAAWLKGIESLANKSIRRLKKDVELIKADPGILPQAKMDAIKVIESVIRFKKGRMLKNDRNNSFI